MNIVLDGVTFSRHGTGWKQQTPGWDGEITFDATAGTQIVWRRLAVALDEIDRLRSQVRCA